MNRIDGRIYLTAAFLLAGSSAVSARLVSDRLGPFAITFYSLTVAVVTALAAGWKPLVKTVRTLRAPQWRMLFLQSLFGIFLYRVLLTGSLLLTSTAEAGIISGTTPAITALLTWLLLREALTRWSLLGIGCTLAGMLLLQGFDAGFDLGHLGGNLLALGAAASESLFNTLARKFSLDSGDALPLHPVAQAGIVSALALLLCAVPAVIEGSLPAAAGLPLSGWLALLWYGGVVTVAAWACFFAGARTCGGYAIASFSGLIAISSLALSVGVLGEPLVLRQVLGCGCIVGAVLLINRKAPGKTAAIP